MNESSTTISKTAKKYYDRDCRSHSLENSGDDDNYDDDKGPRLKL